MMKTKTKKQVFLFLVLCLLFPSWTSLQDDTLQQKTKIYVIPLKQEIFPAAWRTIQKAFTEAEAMKADLIVIHLNTYGGMLDVADSIRTKILNSVIPVYVFIDNNAASAGALISIAAKKIYMRKGSSIGAATVVNQTGEKMPDKYQSFMRSLMRATAEAHGKDTMINGSDTTVSWKRNPRIAEAMVDEDVSLPGIKDTGKILTFTTEEAVKYGYCDGIAESIPDLLRIEGIENYQLAEYQPGAIDKIINFLLNPFVHGILIMLIIGGIYFELQTPGIGFPLAVAIMAALLYFAPLYLEGLAKNWEILIFITGLILLGVEIFVIPGFGIAGFSGIALIIAGLTLSMIDNTNFQLSSPKGLQEVMKALFIVITSIAIAFGLSIYLSKKIFTGNTFGELALKTVQNTNEGYIGIDAELQNLVGQSGYAHTILRPSGKIRLGEEIYDATSLIGYIEKGERVKIVKFQAGQLYVVREEPGA